MNTFQKSSVDYTEMVHGFEDDVFVLWWNLSFVKIILGGLVEGDGIQDRDQRFVPSNSSSYAFHCFSMGFDAFYFWETAKKYFMDQ